MIIWRGWGFLVAVFVFGCSLVMELVTESVMRDDTYYQQQAWPLTSAIALAGLLSWFVGSALNRRGGRTVVDQATGETLTIGGRHDFFFIPMQYWGPILFGLALAVYAFRQSAS